MLTFLAWLLLFVLCWPVALAALVLYPIVWLLLLPFRLVGIAVEGVFRLLAAMVLLPARLLRGRPGSRAAWPARRNVLNKGTIVDPVPAGDSANWTG
jgi:hypothetical protein